MGIKQEIERLRLQERVRLDAVARSEKEEKERLFAEFQIKKDSLWKRAREVAVPFSQKLQKSGAIEILDELGKEMGLRMYKQDYDKNSWNPDKRYSSRNQRAETTATFQIKIGQEEYHFLGIDLTPPDRKITINDISTERIKKRSEELSALFGQGVEMEQCRACLIWDYYEYSYQYHSESAIESASKWKELSIFLSFKNGTYFLKLPEGTILPEKSWNKDLIRKAVAKAYVDLPV